MVIVPLLGQTWKEQVCRWLVKILLWQLHIAQWVHLCLPSLSSWFKVWATYLCFFIIKLMPLPICHWFATIMIIECKRKKMPWSTPFLKSRLSRDKVTSSNPFPGIKRTETGLIEVNLVRIRKVLGLIWTLWRKQIETIEKGSSFRCRRKVNIFI